MLDAFWIRLLMMREKGSAGFIKDNLLLEVDGSRSVTLGRVIE